MEDNTILQGYEIKPWDFSARIYKIISAAVILNIAGLFVFAQTNMMSASACESPFVKNVCSVLDTVYVGSKLLQGEKDYVVKDYNKTEISDADVVWVDTTNVEPQISYPVGYFEIANRDEIAAEKLLLEQQNQGFNNPTTTIPPFNPSPIKTTPNPPKVRSSFPKAPKYRARRPRKRSRGGLLARKQKLPKKRTKILDGDIDDELFSTKGDKNPKKGENVAKKEPSKDARDLKDQSATKSEPVGDDFKDRINKKPLQDFANTVVAKWASKEIDLKQQFVVKFKGKLTKAGKIDPKKFGFDQNSEQGDENMRNIAKAAILAVGDSGWLGYLRDLGAKEVTITLMQNENDIVARVESATKSESEAKTMASGLNSLISITKSTVKLGEDETKLLAAAQKPSYRENVFVIDFKMPKPEAQEMINRKLTEEWAKQNDKKLTKDGPKQPNGTMGIKKAENGDAK